MITCPISAENDFQQMNKEGLTNYPRAIVQLINKRCDECHKKEEDENDEENKDAVDDEVQQLIKQSSRFTQWDVEKIERICSIMGRCHEMVNKIESLFGMRNDIRQMDTVSNTIMNQIDSSRQHFGNLQQHFKKFQDETASKEKTALDLHRLLTEISEGPPPPHTADEKGNKQKSITKTATVPIPPPSTAL